MTVVAAVRDPASCSEALGNLSTGEGSKLVVVKIDSVSETDARDAIELLKSKHGIDRLDVVVANAGIAKHAGTPFETPLAEMRDHFEVNTVGPLVLFQATWPLLSRSGLPKFILITSSAGSIGDMEGEALSLPAYGASKAAANFIVRRCHLSDPELITLCVHPG